MAETKPEQTQTSRTMDWKPGQYWQTGQPIPEDAIVVPHEGGLMTLERKAPEGFDKDLREKTLRQLDLAFERSFKEPSEEHPQGRRPYALYVNRAFRRWFRNLRVWGELEPPVEVIVVEDDRKFNTPNAVKVPSDADMKRAGDKVRQLKALFSTEPPDQEEF